MLRLHSNKDDNSNTTNTVFTKMLIALKDLSGILQAKNLRHDIQTKHVMILQCFLHVALSNFLGLKNLRTKQQVICYFCYHTNSCVQEGSPLLEFLTTLQNNLEFPPSSIHCRCGLNKDEPHDVA